MTDLDPDLLATAVADPSRRRILAFLTEAGTLCVCELVYAFDAPQPRVSQHLARLRAVGMVRVTRIGNRSYYALASDLPAWARQVLDGLAVGAAACGELDAPRARLDAMPDRPPALERAAA
jgi:ArsR family transcriptional regulator